jgi:hypothetical protein
VRTARLVEQVGAQVGGPDRVGFLEDQILALEESSAGRREAESQQQTQETQDGSLERADLARHLDGPLAERTSADPEAALEREEEEQQQAGSEREVLGHAG